MTQIQPSRLLVIILNYRTAQMTLRAVEAALADLPKGGEIMLIDNAAHDPCHGAVQIGHVGRNGP